MSTNKSYPHYEINVKDNSIYNVTVEEVLPVHRAVWVLPTEMGPVGEPIWVRNYSHFCRVFGKNTLSRSNTKYQSQISFWLRQLLSMNGAFIVRAAPTAETPMGEVDLATYSTSMLFARVESINLPQYLVKDGVIQSVADDVTYYAADHGQPIQSVCQYGQPAIDFTVGEVTEAYVDKITGELKYTKRVIEPRGTNPGGIQYATPDGETVFPLDTVPTDFDTCKPVWYHQLTPKTTEGLRITFYTRQATGEELEAMLEGTLGKYMKGAKSRGLIPASDYPILAVMANYVGSYGDDLAYRFFCKDSENSAADTGYFKTIMNSFMACRRDTNLSSTTPITDKFMRNYVTFSADPKGTDPETGLKKDMEYVLESCYDSEAEASEPLPFLIYTFEESLSAIGQMIYDSERAAGNDLFDIASAQYGSYEELEAATSATQRGYMVNVLGGKDAFGAPYRTVIYGNEDTASTDPFCFVSYDGNCVEPLSDGTIKVAALSAPNTALNGLAGATAVKLDPYCDIYLTGGQDGLHYDSETGMVESGFLDKAMYMFTTLQLNNTIVDKFKYPITHIYDIGYSMTTKFAMLDFLDIRDDVGVELASQVLCSNKWVTGFDRPIRLNDQYADIMNGIMLRERALLMKESVLFNTDCMRASIFTQCGRPMEGGTIETSQMVYTEPVPFTYWSAYQHAMYENTPTMSVQEPRGLPYAKNLLFKSWQWVPHGEPQKELTWNAGMNYCQHCNMRQIFYPALRTVYRHETSILVDQWDVDALIYTKHECRKAWAKFVGRNDRREDLQNGIKIYLQDTLAALYSGKYDFEVEVYQTEEEQKIGYIQHVRLRITFPATLRVLVFDIEVNREGYTPEA